MTKRDKDILLQAAEMVHLGRERYSCIAIGRQAWDEDYDFGETNSIMYTDAPLAQAYAEFYGFEASQNWYIDEWIKEETVHQRERWGSYLTKNKDSKDWRIMLLLWFREVGLEGVK